jgi:hypothetical protein
MKTLRPDNSLDKTESRGGIRTFAISRSLAEDLRMLVAIDADDQLAAEQIGALFEPERDARPAESLEIDPDILAHPAVQAEIARQVALLLGRQPEATAPELRC